MKIEDKEFIWKVYRDTGQEKINKQEIRNAFSLIENEGYVKEDNYDEADMIMIIHYWITKHYNKWKMMHGI